MILTRSSSMNCKMTFIIGRGFAERQILKKWKWPYLLNWVKYFDKLLRKHWYWQDLAHEIAKWHFSLVEALPSSKFWKIDNLRYLWNWVEYCDDFFFAYTLILTTCTPWDCQITFEIGWVFLRFKFWKKWDYCKMTFIIGRGFAECQILKKWKWPYLWNWVEYCDRLLRKHWYYQDLAQEIVKCHSSSVDILPSSRFWKSKNGHISGTEWNNLMKFAYTLVYWQFDNILQTNWCWKDLAQGIAKWHLLSVEALSSAKLWKKMKMALSLELNRIFC